MTNLDKIYLEILESLSLSPNGITKEDFQSFVPIKSSPIYKQAWEGMYIVGLVEMNGELCKMTEIKGYKMLMELRHKQDKKVLVESTIRTQKITTGLAITTVVIIFWQALIMYWEYKRDCK